MQWDECMKKNLVKMKRKDPELARSLLKIAIERVKFFSSRDVSVFMLEGIYEAILEVCHAFLALEGYKTLSHECAIEFLRGKKLLDNHAIEFLHTVRKKRHGIKYYGLMLSEGALEKYISKELEIFGILKNELEKRLKIQS